MEEVDMPEDWLGLPCNKALGAQMASMEGNLRCPICSELIKAAMTAKCGHAFCSACVRAWLGRSTETKFCPTCKANRGQNKETHVTVDELRPCPPLDKAAAVFSAVRGELLAALSKPPSTAATAAPGPRGGGALGKRVRKLKRFNDDDDNDDDEWDGVSDGGAAAVAASSAGRRAMPAEQQQQQDRYWEQEEFLRVVKRCPSYHTVKEAKLRPELAAVGLGTGDGPGSLVWKHKAFLRLAHAERDKVATGRPTRSLRAVAAEVEELYRVHHATGGGRGRGKGKGRGQGLSGEAALATVAAQASFKDMVKQVRARLKAQRTGEQEGPASAPAEAAAPAAVAGGESIAGAEPEAEAEGDGGATGWEQVGEEAEGRPGTAASPAAAGDEGVDAIPNAGKAPSQAQPQPEPEPEPAAAEEEEEDEEELEVEMVGASASSSARVAVGAAAPGPWGHKREGETTARGNSGCGSKRARIVQGPLLGQGQAWSWGCSACTFANTPTRTTCAMCATPRPPTTTCSSSSSSSSSSSTEDRRGSRGAVAKEPVVVVVEEDSRDGCPCPATDVEGGGEAASPKAGQGVKGGGDAAKAAAETVAAPTALASPSY